MKTIFAILAIVAVTLACSQFSNDCNLCVSNLCAFADMKSKIVCVKRGEETRASAVIYRSSQCKKMKQYFSNDALQNWMPAVDDASQPVPALMDSIGHFDHDAKTKSELHPSMTNQLLEHNKSLRQNESVPENSHSGVIMSDALSESEMAKSNDHVGERVIIHATNHSQQEIDMSSVRISPSLGTQFFDWSVPEIGKCVNGTAEKWVERAERAFCSQHFLLSRKERFSKLDNTVTAMVYLNPANGKDEHCRFLKWKRKNC